MKKNNNIIKILILLFLFFSCSFFGIKKSYAIYRNTMNTTIHLSVLDPSTSYTINFNTMGGSTEGVNPISKTVNQPIGTLPTTSKANHNFLGWYTEETGGTKITPETLVVADDTYYAHWAKIVCKKAVSRHEETCSYSTASGCGKLGYSLNDTITYGTLPGASSPLAGDAYDCDVNDDGVYDGATERFYFMREILDGNDDNASLIHYTSFDKDGQCDNSVDRGSYGYDLAMSYLPSSSLWDNSELKSFNGTPARFVQFADLYAACGGNTPSTIKFNTCQYILETSRFQSAGLGRSGIWIEKEEGSDDPYRIHTGTLVLATGSNDNTARPVIEIPYNTIEGYREKVSYNVTFNTMGGTAITPNPWIRYENQAVGSLPTTEKEGFTFLGWYDSNNVQITPQTVITGNVEFFAHWEEITESLKYVFRIPGSCTFNGDNAITSESNDCISTVNYTNNNIDYTDNTNVDFAQTANKYIDTHVALYSEDNYEKDYEVGFTIVTYNGTTSAIDGIPGNVNSQATIFNAKLENEALSWPGVVFRKNQNTSKFEISQTINKKKLNNPNLSFTNPVTSADSINVKIIREDGVVKYSVSNYNNGELKTLQDINGTSDYFNHYAWFGGGGSTTTRDATTSSPTTNKFIYITLSNIYIKLESTEVVKHEVNFVGGEDATVTPFVKKDVNHGSVIGTLPTATKSGYAFDGWWTDPTNGTKINENTVINSDETYYAHWKDIYLVRFYSYGGTLSIAPNDTIEVVDGNTIDELPTVVKEGYAFDGWWTQETGGTRITGDEVIIADVSYHAHYKQLLSVTFMTYGGTLVYNGSLPLEQNVLKVGEGDAIDDLPTANIDNQIFDGWYTEETGGTKITGNELITANVTYHAHYSQQATVTFSPGEGVEDAVIEPFDTKTVAYGSAVGALPSATREGYNFLGWFTDTTWTTPVDPDGTTITENVTFVARWEFNDYAAMIGSTKYETLEAAIAAVPTTNVKTTVVLLKNVDITSTIAIAANKNIKFDLQSHTISGSDVILFANSGTVEVTNGTITNIGVDKNNDKFYAFNNLAGGKLYLLSGGVLVTNHPKANTISNNGYVEINGGSITSSNAQGAAINNNVSSSVVKISSGSIITTHNYKNQAIYNNGGTVYVSGDAYLENKSVSGNNGRAALHNAAGTVYITGGTIVSKANSAVKNNGTMVIGTDDNTFDNTTPIMQGAIYGLETVDGYPVTIYDGIFKGKGTTADKAISDESEITYDDTLAELVHEFETIGGVQYDTAYLSSLVPTISYTVTFDENNGEIVGNGPNTRTVKDGSAIGTLPKAEKENAEFLGWFTSTTGGEKLLPTTVIDDDVTYHARYTTSNTVCRPATVLHSSGGNDFGQIHSDSSLSPGDAYDCDVNGDGVYDSANERFYYLTDSGTNAIFVYSNNTIQVNNNVTSSCGATGVAYGSDYSHGPSTAMDELPNNNQWINVSLYTEPRDIKDNAGTSVINSFVYTGKAARFVTLDEIKAATTNSINGTVNELSDYSFLLENTSGYDGSCSSGYWMETTDSSSGAYMVDGSTGGNRVTNITSVSDVRPVIEVPYSVIEGAIQVVEFDTLSPAMRTYFNNISTWSSGQTDDSHSDYDTSMTNNLDNNKCVYFTGDNRNTEINYNSGWNVYCDQPNKYDTGVIGNVNVYEYNELTGTVSNNVASYVTANNGKLYNFIPNKIYYWESATDSTKNGYVKPIGERRVISIDNTVPSEQPKKKMRNVRDLGGIKVDQNGDGTIDGTIKYGKLFRGEKIWGGDGSTVQYLNKLGIYNEIDLRGDSEVNTNEEDSLTRITSNPSDANNKVFEIVHYEIDYDTYNANYVKARDAVARVMYEFVKAHNAGDDNYAVLFHCRIGADRTGTFAYIIEGLLGAPVEERYRDYELTVFFGLRERTRFYKEKDGSSQSNATHKFQYLKSSIRNAGDGVNEDVMTWFLKGGNTTTVKTINSGNVETVNVNLPQLISDFKSIMIDSY
ncbi:MAG: InlB B-repeat-containing protein [Bacilli bacterium]|nr:InlB B-repeat-containing protein [Bacilli bacterium]